MGIDWKRKLSSRKFWAALAAFITSILSSMHVAETDITAVASIVAGLGVLAVYILAEAKTDSGHKPPDNKGGA